MNWGSIRSEVTTLTQDLLRFDTTNPPGNETLCVEALARGVDGELSRTLLNLLDPALHESAMAALPLGEPTKRRLSASLHNTATPTILQAGSKINVIPAVAECKVDCRILPGTTIESLERQVRAVVGNQVEIEFDTLFPGLESDPDSPLFETIRQTLLEDQQGGMLVPGLITGGTDAKRVQDLGIKVYGFIPQRYEGPEMSGLAHGHNERVSVANLEFGTRILYQVVRRFCGE